MAWRMATQALVAASRALLAAGRRTTAATVLCEAVRSTKAAGTCGDNSLNLSLASLYSALARVYLQVIPCCLPTPGHHCVLLACPDPPSPPSPLLLK
jgi:hypothetical protein